MRRKLAAKIDQLGSIEHGEIFRTLQSHNFPFTRNSNGVFFDITDMPKNVICELNSFVDHCLHNQKMLKESRQKHCMENKNCSGYLAESSGTLQPKQTKDPVFSNVLHGISPGIVGTEPDKNVLDSIETIVRDPIQTCALSTYDSSISSDNSVDVKRPVSRFQSLKKKYSRSVVPKTTYVNELRRE